MRRLLVLAALSTVVAFAAVSAAQAAVVVNISIPVDGLSTFVPCANNGAGEIVDLSGSLHVLETATFSRNTVSGKTLVQPQGVIGVGETTGSTYRGVGGTEQTFSTSLQNDRVQLTFVDNFLLISGTDGNLRVHETLHTVIDADGDVTVTHDSLMVDCR